MRIKRLALAGVLAAGLALPGLASADPVDATVRVEGSSATLVPESTIVADTTAVTGRPSSGGMLGPPQARTFPGPTALGQIARAAGSYGQPLDVQFFSFGALVNGIGSDVGSASAFWLFKVNHVASQVGADQVLLKDGDSVLWYFTSGSAKELDLSLSADKAAQATPVTATVLAYDDAGAATPAAGALVRYGTDTAVADGAGHATFSAHGVGVTPISATRGTDIRSAARGLCSFGADPTVCDLPAARPPAQPAPAAPATALQDTVAPGSRFSSPVNGRRYGRVRSLAGTASPDRSDVARVEVAVALRVGSQCRFLGPKGLLGAPRPCSERRYLGAGTSGGFWLLGLPRRMPAGSFRAWSRATDGAGNTESVTLPGVNSVAFSIAHKR